MDGSGEDSGAVARTVRRRPRRLAAASASDWSRCCERSSTPATGPGFHAVPPDGLHPRRDPPQGDRPRGAVPSTAARPRANVALIQHFQGEGRRRPRPAPMRDLHPQPQGRRRGTQPHRRQPRLPLRPLVEPRGRSPGHDRVPHRADARCRSTSSSPPEPRGSRIDQMIEAKMELAAEVIGSARTGSPN